MPKVKKSCSYQKKYSEESLQEALADINNGMPKQEAARKHSIPRSTLQFRLSEKFTKTENGPRTYLTKEEEDLLVTWISESHKKGFPKKKEDIRLSVKSFLDKQPRKTPFKNNLPGDNWYKCFLQRHPNLTSRIPEAVTNASGNVSENDIKRWFERIESYLKEKDLFGILEDPTRVYNGDETCFALCPKEDKVIAPKGSKNVYQIEQGPAKTNITVMFTFSASGCITSPMIIYPYKRLPRNIVESVPNGWGIGASENGWMKAELFYEYISNVLHPYLLKQKVQFPVILFVDGHKTHQTLELSNLCSEIQIILICLYPNATRILQPADVSSFKPLKNAWKRAVASWRNSNNFIQITKIHFAPILKEALSALTEITIANGFRACGLYPWNSGAIDYSKCLGKQTSSQETMITHITAEDAEDKVQESLSLEEFWDICGPIIKNELQQGEPSINTTKEEYFDILLTLTKKLTSGQSSQLEPDINNSIVQFEVTDITDENNIPLAEEMPSFSQNELNDMPIIILNNNDENPNENKSQSDSAATDQIQSNSEECTSDFNESLTCCLIPDEMRSSTSRTDQPTSSNSLDNKPSGSGLTSKQSSSTSPTCVDLNQYLLWPKTPERKGKRQTEKIPYVVTSSGWKKIFDDKNQIKLENQKKKEENKTKREENKKKKLEIGTKRKNKKSLNKPLAEIKKNVGVRKTSDDKAKGHKVVSSKKYDQHVDTIKLGTIKEISQMQATPRKETHVRRLAFGSSPISSTSKHNSDSIVVPVVPLVVPSPPKNNRIVNKGLCHSCTFNISVLKFGFQCQKCSRAFHYKCLSDNHLYRDFFTCVSCPE